MRWRPSWRRRRRWPCPRRTRPPAGDAHGAGLAPGSAAGALRGADFKWVLGRRAIGFLTGLAAMGGAGAEWASLAAPALRAILANAERTVWTRVGHPLRPAYGSYGRRWQRAAWLHSRCQTPRRRRPGPGLARTLPARAGPTPGSTSGAAPARRPPQVKREPAGECSAALRGRDRWR